MSTPLAREQVKEIREIFDHQLRNPDFTEAPQQAEMDSEFARLREKEAILTRLASSKGVLDTKLDQYYSAKARVDADQTVGEVAAGDATWMQSSDESFMRWEQDCDKTVMAKQPASQDPEMAAINRLMREYNLDKAAEDHDQTQLEDVEPPSGIWDTTVLAAKMNASPVKMMHRPSTIIEETMTSTLGNDSIASSYKTAASGYSKIAPSDRYDTAAETICLSSDQSSDQSSNSAVIEILDDSLEAIKKKESLSSSTDSSPTLPANGTLDGISSLMPDDETSRGSGSSKDSGDFSLPESRDSLLEDTPDFNDTLERIEFMEQQGKKLLEKQKTMTTTTTTTTTRTAQPSTPLLAKTLLPSSTTKRVFYPSPNSLNTHSPSGTFKKPGAVRSPLVKFVPPKRNFDHIVSPIATYIKDVPSSTLYTKYKGQCLFSKNSPIKPNTPTKTTTAATEDTKENKQSQMKAPQWNIPRKVFTSTNNRHEIDNRQHTKIPGGHKVHQMVQPALGNPNKIIRHEGRIKMDLHPSQHQPRDSIFDETLANMSVVSGDVSIQVIRDIKKH